MKQGAFAILSRMKDLLSSPAQWLQGRSQDGDKFDLLGAYLESAQGYDAVSRQIALDAVRGQTKGMPLSAYNDSPHTTHAHIYALLERAMDQLQPGWR